MNLNRRQIAGLVAAGLFASSGSTFAQQPAETGSTWERIQKSGKLRMGVVDYPPYFMRDPSGGGWTGAMIDMGNDIAKVLDVKLEIVEVGTWSESILAVQAGKTDMQIGVQSSPERAKAVDFAGPIYWVEWVAVNNPKFQGKIWQDYNKPEVKVAIQIASADDWILTRMAPKATKVELKDVTQAALSVSSGRADAFTTSVLSSMVMKQRNPGLGEFVKPTPRIAMPGYIATRLESDQRFLKFLNRWGEYNVVMGFNEKRMRDAASKIGLDIPETVSFGP